MLGDPRVTWANDFSAPQIKLIGLAEVLSAIGLVLPLVLGVLPVLTFLAAAGLALRMPGAVSHAPAPSRVDEARVLLGVLSAR